MDVISKKLFNCLRQAEGVVEIMLCLSAANLISTLMNSKHCWPTTTYYNLYFLRQATLCTQGPQLIPSMLCMNLFFPAENPESLYFSPYTHHSLTFYT